MRFHLAGSIDLTVAKRKYHKKCLSAYKYHTFRNEKSSRIARIFICSEIHYAADRKQILELSDVWLRYDKLVQETSTQIRKLFMSRGISFKEKLIKKLKLVQICPATDAGRFRERTTSCFAQILP